jgi:hypothetical protein
MYRNLSQFVIDNAPAGAESILHKYDQARNGDRNSAIFTIIAPMAPSPEPRAVA